jgi:hypothetical protein
VEAQNGPTADVVDLDKVRLAREQAIKREVPHRRRAAAIRISLRDGAEIVCRDHYETKQEAYTLLLGCCIMLGRMARELGDTWGR